MFKHTFRSAFLTFCALSAFTISAQSYRPLVTYLPSTAYVEGQAMYILGGTPLTSPSQSTISQTFVIDLSTSWNTTEPIYKKLPDGPTGSAVAALSPNNQSLFTVVNETIYTYDLKSGAWSSVITNTNFISYPGILAVTDPDTGIIYIPNGYNNPASTSMLTISSENKTTNIIAMDPMVEPSSFYSLAWSTGLGSMILTGGTVSGLYAYNPISNGWSNLTSLTKGDIPSNRFSSCLVPAFESKMILFGGVNYGGNSTFYDIYILDVPTLTWKRGPNVAPANGRAMAACSVSNGNFIVWGGGTIVSGTSSAPRDTVLVFDLLAEVWVSKYNVDLLASSAPTTASPTSGGSKSHRVAIACAITAVFVVGFIVLLVAIRRYRSRRSQVLNNDNNDDNEKSKNPASTAVDLTSVSSIPQKQSFYETDSTPMPIPTPTPVPAPVYSHHNSDIQPVARWAKTCSQELTGLSRKESTSTLHESRRVHRHYSHQSMTGSSVGDQGSVGSVRAPSSMSGVSGGKCSIFEDLEDDNCGVDSLEEYEYKLPATVRHGSVFFNHLPRDSYTYRPNVCVSIYE